MTRPVFGDAATIRKIDPLRVVLDEGLDLPVDVLGCAECDSQMHVEFDDTWIEGDTFGAGTLRWYCLAEPWAHNQYYQYQDQVMRDENKVVRWIQTKYPNFRNEC